MRGRKPTAPALKLLAGTWRPDRHGRSAVQLELMNPKPPSSLNTEQRKAWTEIAAAGKPYLAKSDRVAVEMAARLMAAHRAGKLKASHDVILSRLLDKLGCTPAGRARLQPIIPGEKPGNRFADI